REGVVQIKVTPVNDAPVANNDQYLTNEDTPLSLDISRVSGLHMVSETGDFVGGGSNWDYDPTNATFSAHKNLDNGVALAGLPSSTFWFLDFAAPGDALLALGRYTNAMRFPFQDADKPGLAVFGDGRAHNQLVGEFTVRDIEYGTGDTIVSFAATFIQKGLHF